jgi:hypothetical protein
VWKWLRRQSPAKRETVLRGAPVKPRLKTYSAETGYVYQYVHRGYRNVPGRGGDEGREYVFSVTRDRKTYFPVLVVLAEGMIAEWGSAHQRELSETELYAIAKLSLFEAFDQRDDLQELSTPVEPDVHGIDRHLAALGRL